MPIAARNAAAACLLALAVCPALAQRVDAPRRTNPSTEPATLAQVPGYAPPGGQSQPAPPDSELVRSICAPIEEALAGGKTDVALRRLRSAAATEAEGSYELRLLRARVMLALGETRRAREAATAALALRPGGAGANYLLGRHALLRGDLDEATQHLRSATLAAEAEPDSPFVTAAWYHLGQCLHRRGWAAAAAEAYEHFDRAIWDTHPEHRLADPIREVVSARPFGALELRLELLGRLGRWEDAVRTVSHARDSVSADPLVERAQVRALLRAGRADEALSLQRRRAPDAPPTGLLLDCLRAADALSAWIDERLAAAENGALSRDDLARVGRRLLRIGAADEASRLLDAWAAHAPNDADAAWLAALAHRSAGRRERAAQTIASFHRAHPSAALAPATLALWLSPPPAPTVTSAADEGESAPDWAADFARGALDASGGQLASAAARLASSAERAPAFALARVLLGYVALAEFRWNDARACAEAALEIDRGLAAAHYVLGCAADGLDESAAAAAFRQALRERPDDPIVLVALGRHLERNGDPLGAQRYFSEATAADPSDAEAFEALIESYVSSAKHDVARTRCEKAPWDDFDDDVVRRVQTSVRFVQVTPEEFLYEIESQAAWHPGDVRTALRAAAMLVMVGRAEEAVDLVEALRAGGADDESTLLTLSLAQQSVLAYGAAAATLERLAQRYPRRASILSVLADAQLNDGRPEEARATLLRLLDLAADDARRREVRARILASYEVFSADDAGLALIEQWAAQGVPADELLGQRLGLLVGLGRGDEAVRIVDERLAASPGDSRALPVFVAVCRAAKDYATAEARLRPLFDAAPQSDELARELMDLLVEAGRPDDAIDVARRFTPRDWSQSVERRRWLATCAAAADRHDQAVRELEMLLGEQVVRGNPPYAAAIQNQLIRSLCALRDFDGALRRIDEWNPPDPELDPAPEVLRLRQLVCQVAERVDEYIAAGELLLRRYTDDGARPWSRDREYVMLCNDLGYTLVDRGEQLERATRLIRRAVAAQPLRAAYLDSLGWAHYKAGDFAAAREQLVRATRLAEGNDAVIYDHLGDAEFRLGDPSAARALWSRALELAEQPSFSFTAERHATLAQTLRDKLGALERGETPPVAPLAGQDR